MLANFPFKPPPTETFPSPFPSPPSPLPLPAQAAPDAKKRRVRFEEPEAMGELVFGSAVRAEEQPGAAAGILDVDDSPGEAEADAAGGGRRAEGRRGAALTPVGSTPCSSEITSQNFAPIWLPHWPAWMWTISRLRRGRGAGIGARAGVVGREEGLVRRCGAAGGALRAGRGPKGGRGRPGRLAPASGEAPRTCPSARGRGGGRRGLGAGRGPAGRQGGPGKVGRTPENRKWSEASLVTSPKNRVTGPPWAWTHILT